MYSIFRLTYNYYDGPGHGSKVRTKKVSEHLLPTVLGHIVATIAPFSRVSASAVISTVFRPPSRLQHG
jgi:hypothetical protein